MAETKDPGKANRLNESSYKTKYPYNQAHVLESGAEVHFDNTPGAERIRVYHPDGFFWEVSPGGKEVKVTTGHSQEYKKGGATVTIDENNDMKVCGHNRLLVGGGQHSECAGDSSAVTGGHSLVVVLGDSKVSVAGDCYLGVKGDMNLNISGGMDMKIAGDTTMTTGGTHTIKAAAISLNP